MIAAIKKLLGARTCRMRASAHFQVRRLKSKRFTPMAALCLVLLGPLSAKGKDGHGRAALRIYFVDTEGGQATLFITPSGLSLLIDTGFAGHGSRDADRIVAAARKAGVQRLDYVLITHYHGDHVGGVPELAARIPIGTFLDHGPNREQAPEKGWQSTQAGYDAYQKILSTMNYTHIILHPGQRLPVRGLDAMVVSGDGDVIDHSLPRAGAANPSCGVIDQTIAGLEDPDMTENRRSLAVVIQFGRVRILDAGDLTWDRERMLMCPMNKIGHVNIFIVGNHGMMASTSPALVDGIAPQVAIMDNGSTKGATVRVLDLIRTAPNKPVLWQLHYAQEADGHNTEAPRIANLVGPAGYGATQTDDKGFMLEANVFREGQFNIVNDRIGEAITYIAR
ncbi:ComEC/Rec2 family competence protein [Tunturiibacter gelidoferens]|uniref:Beta-lactamase superfamily II metal-dependent hydrolase n=1 Tax=Tunturiibacter gelidiferens TaxID=3069689 RepID=A0A9X0QHE9_9BACT|nr:MBL fold metallo-hydrolase [Edaphobacter lichenicola]MBB5330431.1 beta-lactamase superfamily II metal-dependent hydrolase [Edaphobacter lichenicola]